MTLIGELLWALPFVAALGTAGWVPSLAVAVAAAIGLVSTFVLVRTFLRPGPSAAVVLALLSLPGFWVNTSSFMTDVPAFSAEMVCLLLGTASARRAGWSRWALLAFSMLVGVGGFSVREFDLAAPVAVLLALAARDKRRWRAYLAAGVLAGAACGAVYLWTAHLPGAEQKALVMPSWWAVRGLTGAYFTFAFAVSPVLGAVLWRAWRTATAASWALVAVAIGAGAWLLTHHDAVLIGNYLSQQGVGGGALLGGARPKLFPTWAWQSLEYMAVLAGAALAFVAACRRPRRPVAVPGLVLLRSFTLLSGAGLVAYGLFVAAPLWDRYVWPVAFGASALLLAQTRAGAPRPTGAAPPAAEVLARPERWRRPGRHVALGGAPKHAVPSWRGRGVRGAVPVGLVAACAVPAIAAAVAVTVNADAYDGARWEAGGLAVRAGYPAGSVDAGFEWVGSHATTGAVGGRRPAGAPPYVTWYDQLFLRFHDCAFVSGSPFGGPSVRPLGVVSYQEVGFAGNERLYVLAVNSPSCRPG